MRNYEILKQKLALRQAQHKHAKYAYQLNPCLTSQQVQEIEHKYQIKFPQDYRQFLLEIGEGNSQLKFLPYVYLRSLEESLEEIDPTQLSEIFIHHTSETVGFDTPGILPICHHGCGYYSGLVITGPERGNIWYRGSVGWVPLIHPWEREDQPLGATFISSKYDQPLLDELGNPLIDRDDIGGNQYYKSLLSDVNRSLRLSFYDWFNALLDHDS